MKRLLLLSLPALCAGCLLGPDYERPDTGAYVPESFRTEMVPADTALTNAAPAAALSEADWWSAWDDPLLTNLLERGTAANLSLAQAQARLGQSRATLDAARAALWPSLGLSASASRSKTYDPDDSRTSARAGADAGWEIDLFGRNRRTAEAAAADLEASGLSLEDVRLSLRAEIAADYVALRLAQESLEIARSNLAAEVESAEVARAKGRSGFTAGADVAASDAAIATARAALPAREAAVSAAARALEHLLAEPPFALEDELAAPGPIPAAPAPPEAAPADLLARRPDVRRAEAALHAATARVGAARAARYPSVNLAAGASISSDSLSDWSDALKTLSFGPSVSLPLFQGGALAASEARARATAEEALFAYRDTVLGAVHEAQRDWTDLASERARAADLAEAVRADEEALRAAQELYRAGKGDYTSVLVRRTAWLSARLALAQHRASLADLSISLFKALGGAPGAAGE